MNHIALHSVPRSGSSWLGQIFNSVPEVVYKYQPMFSYAFKGRLDCGSSHEDIIRFFSDIANVQDEFLDQMQAVAREIYPHFEKSPHPRHVVYKEVRYHHVLEHLLRTDPGLNVIGLVRNPLAVLSSWKTAPKEFKPEWDFETEWRSGAAKNEGRSEEFFGFDKWCEVAALFLRLSAEYPHRFHLVRYDRLINDTQREVANLFDLCGVPLGSQTKQFLIHSREKNIDDDYAVYRKKRADDAWQSILPKHIVAGVKHDLAETELEQFLVVAPVSGNPTERASSEQ